jgi:hypothetical protein
MCHRLWRLEAERGDRLMNWGELCWDYNLAGIGQNPVGFSFGSTFNL